MIKHIDSWFSFARGFGLGMEHMEEIVLVTGLHLTRSWATVAFFEGMPSGRASFGFGFRVTRVLGILPRRLRDAAEPNPIPSRDHDEDEPDRELISMPSSTTVKYPFQH